MANSEHLALIKQGVEVWNSWYAAHKKVTPNLARANLSNFELKGINLKRAILIQANLSNADLSEAELNHADLSRASLLGANLSDAKFKNANLDYVIWSKAVINSQTSMADKYLKVYQIVNRINKNKNLSGIDLSNSNLFNADLSNVELSNAKLLNVNFNSANLDSAYLYKADLTGSNLQNTNLKNAYFSHANLTSANLSGAFCCGTYFRDAELKFANLKTAKFSDKTMIDFKWHSVWEIVNRGAVKKNLSDADLSNADLQGSNFHEANLTNAKLSNAILRQSNLANANLTNADLSGADICGVYFDGANLKGAKLKSVISDRHTQLPTVGKKPNLIVQKKLVATTPKLDETKIQPSNPNVSIAETNTMSKAQPNKQSVSKLWLILLGIGGIAVGSIFLVQNPNHPLFQKFAVWKNQVEQLGQ